MNTGGPEVVVIVAFVCEAAQEHGAHGVDRETQEGHECWAEVDGLGS